ncbi:MAG: hypothetical protein MHM6MM_005933 [Cercozoa sp. M6MM]
MKLSRKTVAEYIREHRPHFNLHLHFSRPRFGARRAERVAAAESIARVAEAHARSATRRYGSIVAEQVAAGVRRRQRQLAVQRRLGSLVALHAALVAAQQGACAFLFCPLLSLVLVSMTTLCTMCGITALHCSVPCAATCAPYHDLAQELPFYVPPEKRHTQVARATDSASQSSARACMAVTRALKEQELTASVANELLQVHFDLLTV